MSCLHYLNRRSAAHHPPILHCVPPPHVTGPGHPPMTSPPSRMAREQHECQPWSVKGQKREMEPICGPTYRIHVSTHFSFGRDLDSSGNVSDLNSFKRRFKMMNQNHFLNSRLDSD
jgi:hypothetical protein